MKELGIDEELLGIFREILSENLSESDWAEIESGDYFQSPHYCGGFDASENAFCFSYFSDMGDEFWFQLTLVEVSSAVEGTLSSLSVREPD